MQTSLYFSPMLAQGGIEVLVFLLIAGITALINYLQKKKQGEDEWSEVETPPRHGRVPTAPPAQQPRKTHDWEEELRRMLEGERPQTPPPPAPPPIVRETVPPPLPRHAPVPPPVPELTGHCDNCGVNIEFPANMQGQTVICPNCYEQTTLRSYQQPPPRPVPPPPPPVERPKPRPEPALFKESLPAYERAAHLDELVASRLREAARRPAAMTTVPSSLPRRSREIEQVVSLLRSPTTARQAIIASIILNPPKALES